MPLKPMQLQVPAKTSRPTDPPPRSQGLQNHSEL